MKKIVIGFLMLFVAVTQAAAADRQQEIIVLNSLNAAPLNAHVQLTWTPDNQFTSGNYIIEKSRNGNEFVEVARTQASASQVEFIETDFLPFEGISFYRLRMIDTEGNVSFSNTVPVKFVDGKGVSPVAVETSNQSSKASSLLVVARDGSGQEYFSKIEIAAETDPMSAVDLENHLNKGTYHIVGCSDQSYYNKNFNIK